MQTYQTFRDIWESWKNEMSKGLKYTHEVVDVFLTDYFAEFKQDQLGLTSLSQ